MAYRPYDSGEMPADEPTSELASPWIRLVAWLIDGSIYSVVAMVAVIIGVILLIAMVGIDFSDLADFDLEDLLRPFLGVIAFTLLSLFVVFIVQMALLATRGQTIGKIIMGIRIVDARTGEHPGWARLILLRTIVNWLISGTLNAVPLVGPGLSGIYFIVDSLFIFREDRRTIHDLIAGTRVDKIND